METTVKKNYWLFMNRNPHNMKKILITLSVVVLLLTLHSDVLGITNLNLTDDYATRTSELIREKVQEKKEIKNLGQTIKEEVLTNRNYVLRGTIASLSSTLTPTQLVLNITSGSDVGAQVIVNVGINTKITGKFNGASNLSEVSINDSLMIVGKWNDQNKSLFNALHIRDLSIQKRSGVFFGTVSSTDPAIKTVVIETERRGEQKITLSSGTKLVNRKMETLAFSDLLAGHRIRVKGMWNNNTNTITEVSQIKNFTLPVIEKISPTPTPTP